MQTAAIAKTLSGIYRLLTIAFVLFVLYYAQSLVIPLTIAALLAFLLSPVATYLEKWVGRFASIFISVLLAFSVLSLAGYIFAKQLMEFGSHFQNYSELIQAKFKSFQLSGEAFFNKTNIWLEKVPGIGTLIEKSQSPDNLHFTLKLSDLTPHLTSLIESIVGSLVAILTLGGIILLLVIFMLFHREDIRARLIKIMGESRISSSTSAMKDASDKVTAYLFRLLVVNFWFGFFVFLGLSVIGIPNPLLWGCLAGILRFIPYIGSWIAALLPIALSFVISDSWLTPILTITFFALIELSTAYFIEPLYYGGGTGVSAFALILAALFWTWLWGPIGLLLSTPLTVCLLVLGQYVANINFLNVLLSQEQPLTPAEEGYHLLLLHDSSEAMGLIETFLQKNSLSALYDQVVLPIIFQVEKDYHLDFIDAEKKGRIYQGLNEIVDFLAMNEQKEAIATPLLGKILCLPSHSLRDELGSTILAQTLSSINFDAKAEKIQNPTEANELIEKASPQALCIVAVAPYMLSRVRLLASKISQHNPALPIIVCLFGGSELDENALDKLTEAGVKKLVYTLPQSLKILQELRSEECHS